MNNKEIAEIFHSIADILEIKAENPFRIRAYRRAAQVIEELSQSIKDIYTNGKLPNIPGIGEGIAGKISELVQTGKLAEYETIKKSVPSGLLEMLNISSVGPKTVALIYKELGITSVEELEKAAKDHKLAKFSGMGEKKEENIIRGIKILRETKERIPIYEAEVIAQEIINQLKKLRAVDKISIAGSLRRQRETIGDIDILVASKNSEKVMDAFTTLPQVKQILAKGSTRSSVRIEGGRQVDIRVVETDSFGAALHYFTGSKAHNIRIRELGIKKGLKINEYGVFKRALEDKKIAGREEIDVFKSIGMPYICPEIREDRGEIEAGLSGTLPKLIEIDNLRGDLHIHSNWSDGTNSIEEMAEAAIKRGYKYIAICDHSKSLKIAGGLHEGELIERQKEIDELNNKYKNFQILSGIELEIHINGELDFSDDILESLNVVIGAIHTGFSQDEKVNTARIIKAMENRNVDIIAHPTGRLLGKREGYKIDIPAILKAAGDTETALEINAFPERMDLADVYLQEAKEKGAKFAINTDAHSILQLDFAKFGIGVARRGWLEKQDVINCLNIDELQKFLETS
ncbi:DNA polymerase/3'-5' exonuclease PolX [bacterium]|nr:DNA polymerase/3'-5' exonuclease PolX [bacterium]